MGASATKPDDRGHALRGNTPDTVQADLIGWICFPGQYMLQAGRLLATFMAAVALQAAGRGANHTSLCEAPDGRATFEGHGAPALCCRRLPAFARGGDQHQLLTVRSWILLAMSGNDAYTPCPRQLQRQGGSTSCEGVSGKRADTGAVCMGLAGAVRCQ